MSKLSELVEGAYHVCKPCGEKYGRYAAKEPLYQDGTCDICDRETLITKFSNFGLERDLEPGEKFTREHLDD